MSNKLFLRSSKSVSKHTTDLFDFVWPTAAGMWNLRWQVDGYLRAHANASDEDLNSRFVQGSSIRGANLRKSCVASSWESQQEAFARFLLIDLCALYESWAESALNELGLAVLKGKDLQFPNPGGGMPAKLQTVTGSAPTIINTSLYPRLVSHKKNSRAFIDELLRCYRFFKECRNCIVHASGIADQLVVQAFTDFSSSAARLGLAEIPAHYPPSVGARIKLSLRGVVGFGDVILRLVATLDAELSRTAEAEQLFISWWKQKYKRRALSTDAKRRHHSIRKLVVALNLPSPTAVADLDTFLCKQGLAY